MFRVCRKNNSEKIFQHPHFSYVKERKFLDTSLHASDGWLELYALRRLSGSEVEQIEEHLLLCRSCLDRLEEIGTFALAMRDELKGLPAKPRPRSLNRFRWLPPRIALAGALAVV